MDINIPYGVIMSWLNRNKSDYAFEIDKSQ